MSKTIWRILSVIEIALACAALLVAMVKGGCTMQIETAAGAMVPMKCHWTFLAVGLMAALGIVSSICACAVKDTGAKRVSAVFTAAVFVIVLLAVNLVMGVCSGDMSECRSTALVVNIISAIGAIIALVQLFGAREQELPKRQL